MSLIRALLRLVKFALCLMETTSTSPVNSRERLAPTMGSGGGGDRMNLRRAALRQFSVLYVGLAIDTGAQA